MEITSLIKNLFLTNDKFSIIGLGTFISKPKSAVIDKVSGEITPPSKEIIFDTRPEQTDTILRDSLLNSGLSEEQASIEIANFVENVKKALSNNDNYQIPDLGFFYKNQQGLIEFSTTATSSLIPEAAGFNKILLKNNTNNKHDVKNSNGNKKEKQTKVKKEKQAKIKSPKPPKIKKEKTQAAIKTPKVKKEKTASEKEKSKKIVRSFLIIAPIIIILGLLGFFYKPILEQGKKLFSANKDSIENKINTPITDENDSNTVDLNNQLGNDDEYKKILNSNITNTAEVNLGQEYSKFYIIVGSFSTTQNAEQYAKQLRNLGYSPVVIDGTNQRYYRVSLGSYETADNLISDYTDFSNKYGKELWVLINKE